MKINQSNYELFFLDFLDGKLSDDQTNEFLDFLKVNPKLKEELKSITEIKLPADEVSFPWKNKLIKGSQDYHSFNYRAIAFMEGNLSDEDQKAFVKELDSDPKKEHEFDLILNTKLTKVDIRYPDKKSLYRQSRLQRVYWSARVAAVIVLLITIWAVFQKEQISIPEPAFSESLTPVLRSDDDQPDRKQKPATSPKAHGKISEAKNNSIAKNATSIGERTKGSLEKANKQKQVVRIAAPEKIKPIIANLGKNSVPQVHTLEKMKAKTIPKQPEYISLDKYLAQKIFKTNKKDSVELDKIVKAGLKVVSGWSNEKLAYETNDQGQIAEISLKTSLLGFSIPVSKNK